MEEYARYLYFDVSEYRVTLDSVRVQGITRDQFNKFIKIEDCFVDQRTWYGFGCPSVEGGLSRDFHHGKQIQIDYLVFDIKHLNNSPNRYFQWSFLAGWIPPWTVRMAKINPSDCDFR